MVELKIIQLNKLNRSNNVKQYLLYNRIPSILVFYFLYYQLNQKTFKNIRKGLERAFFYKLRKLTHFKARRVATSIGPCMNVSKKLTGLWPSKLAV